MPDNDLFLQTIEAVYASGLDRRPLAGSAGINEPHAWRPPARVLEIVDKSAHDSTTCSCTVGVPTDPARTPSSISQNSPRSV